MGQPMWLHRKLGSTQDAGPRGRSGWSCRRRSTAARRGWPATRLGMGLSAGRLEQTGVFAVALVLQSGDGDEPQRRAVDAVAQTAGARAVREEVAEVAFPVPAADLGANHPVRRVGVLDHVGWLQRSGEAGPAGAAVELVVRAEEWLSRGDVHVDPGLVVVPVLVLKRRLGARLLGDLVLQRRQTAAQLVIARLSVHAGSLLHSRADRRLVL